MPKKQRKQQVNWRLSETAREIIRRIAESQAISQGAALEILLREEAVRRSIVVKAK